MIHLMKEHLSEYFPGNKNYFKDNLGGKTVFFLNSGKGTISASQLKWLQTELKEVKDCIIFMHHPPMYSDVVYMDKNWALKNQDELQDILYSHPHPIHVFCGHYHVAKEFISKNVYVNICPSTYYQIHETSRRFAIGSKDYGYRVINLHKGVVSSETVWFKG